MRLLPIIKVCRCRFFLEMPIMTIIMLKIILKYDLSFDGFTHVILKILIFKFIHERTKMASPSHLILPTGLVVGQEVNVECGLVSLSKDHHYSTRFSLGWFIVIILFIFTINVYSYKFYWFYHKSATFIDIILLKVL